MKLLAKKIEREGKKIILHTEHSEYSLNLLLTECKAFDKMSVTVKAHKENRSTAQNNMLWAVISKISDNVNASHREEDMMNIYIECLRRANAKYVILAAVEEAEATLRQHFRFVHKLPNSMETQKGKTMWAYKCFIGSSKFDTKEMTELLDTALDFASEVGIKDSEIALLQEAYKL
jgi:hypothetical protein